MNRLLGAGQALIGATFYGLLLVAMIRWATRFDRPRVLDNYRRVMMINALTSLGFGGFLVLHLWPVLGSLFLAGH
jgi:hypothetical protein